MKGYPAKSGTYWVKTREYNPISGYIDLEMPTWAIALIMTTYEPAHQVLYLGGGTLKDVRNIYEYEEIKEPS